ncbi:MAG: TatD family deoxyribonuclease [Actinobacteria bacterium]|uniref:TatD family deoxyribonuclease n=1 Tax=Candidatus Fonsibacter lacus TaxID=2576439 RepID=A0A965LKQ5_9PROT|nr:TatD family deoxyribonuclease [Candidatus Fonsibacter lacus]
MSDRHNRDIDRLPAPLPEPLPSPTIDSHCHIELIAKSAPDSEEVKAVLDEAAAVGIEQVVQIGYDLEQSRWSVGVAEAWIGRALAAVALHPNEAPVVENLDEQLREIEKLAERSRVRGIGETGLDYFRTPEELRERQEFSFRAHIAIAKKTNKALIIHDRDAHEDILRVLHEEGAPEKVVFHCYSGDAQMAEICIRAGYFLSFSGTVTFKNAPQLREALALTPLSHLLVETDAPFLAPVPYRGLLSSPAQVARTIRFMAEVMERPVEELCQATRANALAIFGNFS